MSGDTQLKIIGIHLGLSTATFIIGVTNGLTEHFFRVEAIEAGVAEWTINPKTGEKKFSWVYPEND